ncbi:ABC transporter permease, partial [Pseudoalteromonas ruthenica]
LAFIAGSGLAMAGLILQTVTRNPLADPYLFGISSGASFGVVVLSAVTGIQAGLALSGAAFAGSLLAMTLLLLIAKGRTSGQVEAMLLAGVALSFLFSSFTSLLLYWSDPQAISAILFWNLGSFSRA